MKVEKGKQRNQKRDKTETKYKRLKPRHINTNLNDINVSI